MLYDMLYDVMYDVSWSCAKNTKAQIAMLFIVNATYPYIILKYTWQSRTAFTNLGYNALRCQPDLPLV